MSSNLQVQQSNMYLNRMDVISQNQEWMNIFQNIIEGFMTAEPLTIDTKNDMYKVTDKYYKDLRSLAITQTGYIGDAFIDKIKSFFNTLRNKKVVLQIGVLDKIVFKDFQYEFVDAVDYDTTKSFACFHINCKITGNYKRIFVCDIRDMVGHKIYLTDCSIVYKYNKIK